MTVRPVTPELVEHFELKNTTRGLVITGVDPDGVAADTGVSVRRDQSPLVPAYRGAQVWQAPHRAGKLLGTDA